MSPNTHPAFRMCSLLVSILFSVLHLHDAFYLPGVAPKEFMDGNPIDIKVRAAA
jgi:hypothetical protein